MTLGDRLLVMHMGVPVQLATPLEVFEKPANTYVAGFIGAPSMNFLDGVLSHGGTAVQLDVGPLVTLSRERLHGTDGQRVTLGIRPEHLELDPRGMALHVDLIEPLGSETVVIGRLDSDVMMSIKVPGAAPPGETVHVGIRGNEAHVFDAGSGLRLRSVPAPMTAAA
jgi:sn-glycerol 3-phosphate transport system ATP-binding protein